MIASLAFALQLGLAQSAVKPAYYVESTPIARIKPEQARAAAVLFTPDPNILLIVARDKELRWIDIRKNSSEDVIRTSKIGEQPELVLSAEQKTMEKDAVNWLETIYGTANIPDLKGEVMRVPGDKEFCITDRHDEFFFYSTETGELLRKIKLQVKNIPSFSPDCQFSKDFAYVNLPNYEGKVQNIYDTKTGKLVVAIPTAFMGSVCFAPDGTSALQLIGNKLTTYALPSGKVASTMTLPVPKATNMIASPSGNLIAYDVLTASFNYGGTNVYDLATKKTTPVTKDLSVFGAKVFSPDGSKLIVGTQKMLHFVDVKTGAHELTMLPSFQGMWDVFHSLAISADNSRVILVNDPNNINVDLRYSITYNLTKNTGEVVKKPIKRPN